MQFLSLSIVYSYTPFTTTCSDVKLFTIPGSPLAPFSPVMTTSPITLLCNSLFS